MLLRTYYDPSGNPRGKIEQTLKSAAMTATFACPLCVLGFAYSVLATTIAVCVIPVFAAGSPKIYEKSGVLEDENLLQNNILAYTFTALRYLCPLGFYGGFRGVCYGIIVSEPPKGTWEGEIPPVLPAEAATMDISIQFLAVYLFAQIARSYL